MGLTLTLGLAGLSFILLVASGLAQARRRVGRWSLVPWDYAMIVSAILVIVFLAHAANQWRASL